jgi:hypothetical protein
MMARDSRLGHLAQLLAAHVGDNDRVPREPLREAYAATVTTSTERRPPSAGGGEISDPLDRRLRRRKDNGGQDLKSAARGMHWKPGHGSDGRRSSDRLARDLVRLERRGVLVRECDTDSVRVVDWVALLELLRGDALVQEGA